MTNEQRTRIKSMRQDGLSYAAIAGKLEISVGTVKTFCNRNGLGAAVKMSAVTADSPHRCLCCGGEVSQASGRKEKKFCSDTCRMKWWSGHRDMVSRHAVSDLVCPYCKKHFTAYGSANRKYCSHACYTADRFGGDSPACGGNVGDSRQKGAATGEEDNDD